MSALRVLIADDNDGFRRVLALYLGEQEGVEIVGEAVDGLGAITQAEKMKPDLVLMDLDMPGGDGFEATREIKLRSPNTTVIILSMHGGEVYRRNAWRHAADGFIDKSSMRDDLRRVMNAEQMRIATANLKTGFSNRKTVNQ